MLETNCLIGQSGGPTAVINSSVLGILDAIQETEKIDKIYGMKYGIKGLLKGQVLDFTNTKKEELELLKNTPSSILGSCRYKLDDYLNNDSDYIKIFAILARLNIKYLFYIGGNDSMDTVNKLNNYAKEKSIDIKIIGIPKTIDNDLVGTDHCPGYGSAAKYIATSVMEIARDSHVYDKKNVHIIEVMGRNSGWLAGASVLAQNDGLAAPDFIYLPEVIFNISKFGEDIKEKLKEKKSVVAVVAEGIKNKNGEYVCAAESSEHDIFGHKQMGGVASKLAYYIQNNICNRVKFIEFNVLQRSAAHCASGRDIKEAYICGKESVKSAIAGKSGMMVGLERVANSPYRCEYKLIKATEVANKEKKVPAKWINKQGNGVTEEFKKYVLPLIAGDSEIYCEKGLPCFANLNIM